MKLKQKKEGGKSNLIIRNDKIVTKRKIPEPGSPILHPLI